MWPLSGLLWVLNTPYRIRMGIRRMASQREHREYADAVVYQTFLETLDKMVDDGTIDPPDRERIKRKMSWHIPLPISNERFIEQVAQLQQKEGEAQTQKPVDKGLIQKWIDATKPKRRVVRKAKPLSA